MLLDILHAMLDYSILENFRGLVVRGQGLVVRGQGLELQGRGQAVENWSSRTRTFLEDDNTGCQQCC